MTKYELVSGWIWRCDNSEVRTDDPAGAIEELEALIAEKDAIIDNLQQALNCASEDFVHSERISEVRNKTAEIWELNYELACRRADDTEQRAKEAEQRIEVLEEELNNESRWTEYYFHGMELWQKRALYAGKKYHELRRIAEACFDARRKDTVRMISDWHRYDALEQACDQAISNLRVVVSLAEGSEEEDAIIDIIQTTCGELMQAINGGQR